MSIAYDRYIKSDPDTGEFLGYGAVPVKEPDFIKVYIMNLLEASKDLELSSEMSVFIGICHYASYGLNGKVPEASIGQKEMEEIGEYCSLSWQRVRNIVTDLVKRDWLRRSRKGHYQINPYYVAKGEWKNVRELQFNWTKEGLSVNIIREGDEE